MNRGTTRHPKYFCDKCGAEIKYSYRRGFIGLYTYARREKNAIFKKSFDLCTSCNNELKNWLENKDIPTTQQLINSFQIFRE